MGHLPKAVVTWRWPTILSRHCRNQSPSKGDRGRFSVRVLIYLFPMRPVHDKVTPHAQDEPGT